MPASLASGKTSSELHALKPSVSDLNRCANGWSWKKVSSKSSLLNKVCKHPFSKGLEQKPSRHWEPLYKSFSQYAWLWFSQATCAFTTNGDSSVNRRGSSHVEQEVEEEDFLVVASMIVVVVIMADGDRLDFCNLSLYGLCVSCENDRLLTDNLLANSY